MHYPVSRLNKIQEKSDTLSINFRSDLWAGTVGHPGIRFEGDILRIQHGLEFLHCKTAKYQRNQRIRLTMTL